MSHYHCGINIPGYMPEGDIETYRTQTEAISWLMDTKERLLDHDYDPDIPYSAQRRFHGNARKDLGYWYVCDRDTHDLGLSIWADQCGCGEGEEELAEWEGEDYA